jgi:predicted amidohydrolase
MLVSVLCIPAECIGLSVFAGRITCHFVGLFFEFLVDTDPQGIPVRYFYYSKGTQIYCAPTVDARPVWQHSMKHIAIEGRCFVLSACQFAQEKDYPADHPVVDTNARDAENVMIAGGSVIVNPFGEVLAGPLLGSEGVLTAELDLNECIRGKFDLDVAGHYARPDGRFCEHIMNDFELIVLAQCLVLRQMWLKL